MENPFHPPQEVEGEPRLATGANKHKPLAYVVASTVWAMMAVTLAVSAPPLRSTFADMEIELPLLTRALLRRNGEEKHLLVLGPISVVPSQTHRGIGSELIRSSIQLAKEKGYGSIVALGHPEYYKRFGFVLAKDLGVTCNLPAPADALTVKEIVDGNLAGGGHIEYPEPFVELY